MKDLEVTRIKRIVKLHDRIIGNLKQSLNDALQIGKLLIVQIDLDPDIRGRRGWLVGKKKRAAQNEPPALYGD